jgi:hypothetical protein
MLSNQAWDCSTNWHVSVSISPSEPKHVTADDVAQAHRLADALAAYIADLETHVTTPGSTEGVAA